MTKAIALNRRLEECLDFWVRCDRCGAKEVCTSVQYCWPTGKKCFGLKPIMFSLHLVLRIAGEYALIVTFK